MDGGRSLLRAELVHFIRLSMRSFLYLSTKSSEKKSFLADIIIEINSIICVSYIPLYFMGECLLFYAVDIL